MTIHEKAIAVMIVLLILLAAICLIKSITDKMNF